MKMKAPVVLLAAAVVLATCGNAQATFDALAISAKAGTLGLGGDLTTDIIPQVNFRAGIQWIGLGFDAQFADVDYNVDLDVLHPLVLVDWFLFDGSFHISGGVLFNGGDIQLQATSAASVEIDNVTYTAAELGTLRGDVEFRPVAPYIGIGWGNPLGESGRWGLVADIGVAFTGSPDVDLSASGPITTDPTFQTRLAEEEKHIQDDLDFFRIYPVLSISLYYRF